MIENLLMTSIINYTVKYLCVTLRWHTTLV